jgi:Undecaprenyl-phosphate glucose phosphotransferase
MRSRLPRGGRGKRTPWRAIPASVVCVALAASDALAVSLAGALALLVYGDLTYIAQSWPTYLALSLAGATGMLVLGSAGDLYRSAVLSTPFLRPWRAVACWTATLLVLLGAVFFFRPEEPVSRGWVSIWFQFSAVGLGLVRLVMRGGIARWRSSGRMRRRVAVICPGGMAAELVARFAEPARRDFYQVDAVFHDQGPEDHQPPAAFDLSPTEGSDHQLVREPDALVPFIRDRMIDTVIIGFSSQPSATVNRIIRELTELPVEVVLCPDCSRFAFPVMHAHVDGELPLLQISRPPLGEWARIVKRLEDWIIAVLMLIGLSPVMLLAALAIRLDSRGPLLFRQQRFGFNNRPISVLKFRSMHVHLCDATGAERTVPGDPRVTRVGRWLRATSIDELPQLFNVLRGEMSLVGPRAHPMMMKVTEQFYHEAVDGYAARHRVKPGITGLAQINGCRGEVDTMEKARARIRYDLEYVSRWSLWFDLKIMLLTPIRALHKVY